MNIKYLIDRECQCKGNKEMYRYHTVKKAISRFQGKKLILKTNEEINQEFNIISFINKHVTIRRFQINVFFLETIFSKVSKGYKINIDKA